MKNQASTDRDSSALWGRVFLWIGAAVLLPLVYFLAGPWFVLFAVACIPALNGDNPPAKALEWSMYPAMQLAEIFEPYNDYFWGILAPLGG